MTGPTPKPVPAPPAAPASASTKPARETKTGFFSRLVGVLGRESPLEREHREAYEKARQTLSAMLAAGKLTEAELAEQMAKLERAEGGNGGGGGSSNGNGNGGRP